MTPLELEEYFKKLPAEVEAFVKGELKNNIGEIAARHYTESFQQEGFVDESLEKWKEVKRRLNPKIRGVRKIRKILTGDTGDLGRSVKYERGPSETQVTIFSDIPYGAAHNEGTENAGRGRSTKIPQRKFIGESQKLNEKIKKEIEDGIGNILK